MPSPDPFEGIFETKRSPHARTLRTAFIEKVQDAFWVFSGQSSKFYSITERSYVEHANNHLGFLDYLGLGIPYLFGKLFDLARGKWDDGRGWKFLVIAVGVIYFPLFIAKHGISAILTFASLLVIGIVHVCSQYIAGGAEFKKQALALPVGDHSLKDELVRNDPQGQLEDILECGTFGVVSRQYLRLEQYRHSLWRDFERRTCEVKAGEIIPTPTKFGFTREIKTLEIKLPILKGYSKVVITPELPEQPEQNVLYLPKSRHGIDITVHSFLNNHASTKVLTQQECEALNDALAKLPEYAKDQNRSIFIGRGTTPEGCEKTAEENGRVDNKELVNEIMSICGYTLKNRDGDIGSFVLDREKNLAAFKSLFTLNVGNVTSELERTPNGQALLDAVLSAPSP